MSEHREISNRANRIIEQCPSHLQGAWIGDIWIHRNTTFLMVHTMAGDPIYVEDARTGDPVRWNADRFAEALEALRRHQVLEDLSDV